MSKQLTKQDIFNILPINDLIYSRTAPSSPIIERTQKRSYAEGGGSTKFDPGSRLIINLQSGVEFIDPLQSFLVFDVKVDANTAYILGSILNLIKDVQVTSRDGKELERIQFLNLLNYHRLKATATDFQQHNLEGLVMFNDRHTKANIDAQNLRSGRLILDTNKKRVMIPMKYISGLFDSKKLMPPHLARGLKIDLTLEQLTTALTQLTANFPGTYEITKPFIMTDNYRMADSVLEFLNAEFASKKTGLVYEYFSYHTTSTVSDKSSTMDVEVRRSVSMAIDAFCVTRDKALASTAYADSFASFPAHPNDSSQWRIGSHYLPNQPSEGTPEHYAQMLYWENKLREDKISGASYYEFKGSNDRAGIAPNTDALYDYANFGLAKFPVTLQRNNILDLSGIAINNSSTMEINAKLGDASVTRNVQIFLRHLRRAVLFMESIVMET